MALHYKSLLLLVLSLLVAFDLASGATCEDKTELSLGVASACEAEGGICPAACETKLRAYIEGCYPSFAEVAFLVVATNKDACFDVVFGFYAELRGSDCASNHKAYSSMWPAVCIAECTPECIEMVEGVCNHCSGGYDTHTPEALEIELSISAVHCPQAQQCDLGSSGSSSSGSSSSSGTGSSSGSSSSSSSGGQGRGGGTTSLAFSSIVVSLAFVWFTISTSVGFLDN